MNETGISTGSAIAIGVGSLIVGIAGGYGLSRMLDDKKPGNGKQKKKGDDDKTSFIRLCR